MKKILVVISGGLPIPSIKGGAVETLIDMFIKENEIRKEYQFEVYSAYCNDLEKVVEGYKYSKFNYINMKTKKFQFSRYLRVFINRILHIKINYAFINEVIKDIKKKHKENYYDLILVENNESLVLPLRKIFNQKIVLHLHNDNVNIEKKDSKKICNECNSIYVVSNYIKKRVEEVCGKGKVYTLLNGIDTKKFLNSISENERVKMRKKLGINKNDFVFVYTGRLCKEKGVKELIQSFKKIQEKVDNVKLMIIGASFYSSNKKDKYIKELIKISEKEKDKIIFTGYINYNEIWKYYKLADSAVMPSVWEEPAGLAMLEAYISGLPLITTNSGGIPEYVSNKKAYIIKKEDIEKNLTNAMLDVYKNYNEYKKNIDLNQYEIEKYDTQTYVNNFYKLINKEFD